MLVPLLEALLALLPRPEAVPVPCPVDHADRGKGRTRPPKQQD